jgi:SAM-dependent methyltransferase
MGWWTDRVVPRIVDMTLRNKQVGRLRDRALAGLEGDVVEIGFGSGLTLGHYPPTVTCIRAVEPSELAREMAAPRIAESTIPVEFAGLDGQVLALADDSVDNAVSTFSLCTIPDVGAALREVRRVVRPGGQFRFLEHGLAEDPKIVAWQHRCNGLQGRIAGGCHLDRPIEQLVRDAGFVIEEVDRQYMPGPGFMKPFGYLYLGRAHTPAAA